MKLNKSKLRKLAQSGEVTAAPISLKRKKVDEGPSKQPEEKRLLVRPFETSVPLVKDRSSRHHGGCGSYSSS
jgi:hypothetical protein